MSLMSLVWDEVVDMYDCTVEADDCCAAKSDALRVRKEQS
jgi:hypothetical protein